MYANISGYPVLWQLYNETLKTHLAHPVGDKYLVYYSPVENSVFCDWDKLVVSSINDIGWVQSLENSVPFKYKNENMKRRNVCSFCNADYVFKLGMLL